MNSQAPSKDVSMHPNRLVAMRMVERNLRAEGHTSRADCIAELCNEIERLQRELAGANATVAHFMGPDGERHIERFAAAVSAHEPRAAPSADMIALCIEMEDWLRPEVTKEPDRSFFWLLVEANKRAKSRPAQPPGVRSGCAVRAAIQDESVDEREDMENIGRALMNTLKQNLPDYSWLQCPSEVVADLINQRDEASAAQPPCSDTGLMRAVIRQHICDCKNEELDDPDGHAVYCGYQMQMRQLDTLRRATATKEGQQNSGSTGGTVSQMPENPRGAGGDRGATCPHGKPSEIDCIACNYAYQPATKGDSQ